MKDERDSELVEAALFGDILFLIWRQWKIPAACAGTLLLLSIIYSHIADPIYEARMVVSPAQQLMDDNAAIRSSGGLPFDLPFLNSSESVSDYALFAELYSTTTLIERIERKRPILREFYRRSWNNETGKWEKPGGLEQFVRDTIGFVLGLPDWSPPDANDLISDLPEYLVVETGNDLGLYEIRFRNKDKAFALEFINLMWSEANELLRERSILQADLQRAHLLKELETAVLAEHRRQLSEILAQVEQRQLLAISGMPFAADILEGPLVLKNPVSPKPILNGILSILFGIFIGALVVLVRGAALGLRKIQSD